MWSVIAFTDEPILELGLRALLRDDAEFALTCVCDSRLEFLRAAEEQQPDILLYSAADDANLSVAMALRRVAPRSAIVVCGRDLPSEVAHQALNLGVRGFVCRSAQPGAFKECLRVAAGGDLWMEQSLSMRLLNSRPIHLSRRQTQLVGLLVQGLKNKEIATSLGISEGTVKAYLTTLFEKVGAKDRFELALYGLKNLRHLQGAAIEEEEAPLPSSTRSALGSDASARPLEHDGLRPERKPAPTLRKARTAARVHHAGVWTS